MGQENLGRDVAIKRLHARALSIYQIDETLTRSVAGRRGISIGDFATVAGRDNLGQALVMRLLTPRGELASLGHSDYGARLHEVIGQPNTETTRNLAKLFVIEALKAERRVAKIESVDVTPHVSDRFTILVAISVLPIGSDVLLALNFAVEL